MSFNRSRSQLLCESFFSVQWQEADFKNLILDSIKTNRLRNALIEDSRDLYFKGLLSLFESINSLNNKLFSWATIKSYYSVFYFLKVSLAIYEVAIIRQKSLFYLKCNNGVSPVKKNNKKYNTDHSGTIHHFIDLFGNTDVISSQEIEDRNPYVWLMEKREQVNYRERSFNEPLPPDFLIEINKEIEEVGIEVLIRKLIEDEYVLTFQPEYAAFAIPIKRALVTKKIIDNKGIEMNFPSNKKEILKELIPNNMGELILLVE